ncbi:MAG: hypothetical protein ACEPO2_07455 [Pelagibaca sp.]
MTDREQALADDRMRAEIARIITETAELNKETRWYELVIFAGGASALTLTIVAVTKLFL